MLDGFFCGEAQVSGRRQKMVFEFAQLAFAILLVRRSKRAGFYKSAYAAPRFDDPGAFELQIDFGDCIGVNPKFHCQLPNGGQLVSHSELACRDRKPDRPLKLMIERRRVRGVYV